MKGFYTILSCTALLFSIPVTLLSQATETVDVTASIQANITLTKQRDVLFGDVAIGSTPVIDPNGSPRYQDMNSAQAQFGKVKIQASAGSSLIISWSPNTTVTMTNSLDSQVLPFTIDISGSQSDNDAVNSTDITNGTAITTSGSSGLGYYYLYVGGTLGTIPSSQTTTSYTGTLTISVIYQ